VSSEALHPRLSIRRRAHERIFHVPAAFAATLALGALVSMLYVNQTSVVATTGYEVRGLETERDQWLIKNEQLRLKLSEMRSLDRVADEATKLGMGAPEKRVFVTRKATTKEWVASPISTPASAPSRQKVVADSEDPWDNWVNGVVEWIGSKTALEQVSRR
jgi:hypothetical protein